MSKKNPRNKSPLATVCKNTFLVLIEWTCLQPHHRWVLECWCLTLNSRYCNFLLDWRAVCTFCEGIPAIGLFFAKKCFFVLCPFLENTKFCLAVTSYTVFLWRLDSCSIGRAEWIKKRVPHREINQSTSPFTTATGPPGVFLGSNTGEEEDYWGGCIKSHVLLSCLTKKEMTFLIKHFPIKLVPPIV